MTGMSKWQGEGAKMKKRKILKLSTNSGGGATIAAERQAHALRKEGHTVMHLFVRQDWSVKDATLFTKGDDVFVSVPMDAYLKPDLLFQAYLTGNRTAVSNTYMSLWRKESPFDQLVTDFIQEQGFDIIHLHWTSNLVSSKLLDNINALGIKVVITGHDMNHFTGACHYDAGCGLSQHDCHGCIQLTEDPHNIIAASMAEKRRVWADTKPTFIFPSDWLNQEYKKSRVAKEIGEKSSTVLRNCLDTEYFSPADQNRQAEIRAALGFEKDQIIVVSGAENNNEIRKGFDYFEGAVQAINRKSFGALEQKKITFVAFGGGDHIIPCAHPLVEYKHLGVLEHSQVRDLFQIADLLAFTSIEENFANIILEALMCACPVIGFDIGGIPDIVEQGLNGSLVSEVNQQAYSDAVASVLLNQGRLAELKTSTLQWRKDHAHQYSESFIAAQLASLYNDVENGVYA